MTDRYYVASVFSEVFDHSSHEPTVRTIIQNVIKGQIINNSDYFGGSFWQHDAITVANPNIAGSLMLRKNRSWYPEDRSGVAPSMWTAESVPETNIVREAYRQRACSLLTSNWQYLKGALINAELVNSTAIYSTINNVPINSTTVKKIYRLFYPAKDVNSHIEALNQLATNLKANSQVSNNFEVLKILVYTTCLKPNWQAP